MEKMRLGDIAQLINGDRGKNYPSQSDIAQKGEIPFVNAGHLNGKGIDFKEMNYISEEKYNKLNSGKFQKDDILYCLRGSLGKKAIVSSNINGAIASSLVIIRPDPAKVSGEYLMFALDSPAIREQLVKANNGSSQPNLSATSVREYRVELPELSLQEEVVEKLEKVRSIIDGRKQEVQLLDDLIRARFVELFGLPVSNTKGWETEQMGEVAPTVNYKGEFDDEVWLLNLDMVEAQTGRILDYLIVSEEEVGNSTCTFNTSNVLYSKLRPYLNKVVIPDRCGYATSELVPLQPVRMKINREYLAFMLRSDEFVNMINEKVTGAKMPRVSMGDFRKFDVPVPPIELQEQFADFVHQVDKSKVIDTNIIPRGGFYNGHEFCISK